MKKNPSITLWKVIKLKDKKAIEREGVERKCKLTKGFVGDDGIYTSQ